MFSCTIYSARTRHRLTRLGYGLLLYLPTQCGGSYHALSPIVSDSAASRNSVPSSTRLRRDFVTVSGILERLLTKLLHEERNFKLYTNKYSRLNDVTKYNEYKH